jgi:uncharacterized protein YfaS (alpha-2-macroglobulin family)
MELGLYRGSTKHLKLEIFDKDGNKIAIDTTSLSLTIYRPDGTVMAIFTNGFDPQPDGSVVKTITIPETEPTGIWRAVWRYVDSDGNTFVEEVPFVVSDPVS